MYVMYAWDKNICMIDLICLTNLIKSFQYTEILLSLSFLYIIIDQLIVCRGGYRI